MNLEILKNKIKQQVNLIKLERQKFRLVLEQVV